LAEHISDWEHVEVRVSDDFSRVEELVTFRHGKPLSVRPEDMTLIDGTHPMIYIAKDRYKQLYLRLIYL